MRNSLGRFIKGCNAWNKGTNGIMRVNSGSFKKGFTPWNKGIPMRENSKIKESLSKIGKKARYELRKPILVFNKILEFIK